jgi:adenosylcobyric acid synthase
MARALMVQGTGSHVGKSVIVAALCRILARRGYSVAPFKSQNMALNSFITPEGGEIGRAQAYQAEAAKIPPSVLMNPVLLKANSDTGAQVIIRGKVVGNMGVREYHRYKDEAFRAARECYEELSSRHDVIVIEGAGSPAEINLKKHDFVNMKTAEMARAKVLIAADIDKGGVFASMVGTMELLDEAEREMVAGFLINKFRGDAQLLKDGLDFILGRTGKPVLGVIPYFNDIYIQEEDGVALDGAGQVGQGGQGTAGGAWLDDGALDVAVLRLAHISNFTDFDPLAHEPGVRVRYVKGPSELGRPDLLIIPGSKNTISDLLDLRRSGLEEAVVSYFASGGRVAGICGGYQMLGKTVADPEGVESDTPSVKGMGILDTETVLAGEKVTAQVSGRCLGNGGPVAGQPDVAGYEIHMGRTKLGPGAVPLFVIDTKNGEKAGYEDGAASLPGAGRPSGSAWGTYIHGIFENDAFRRDLVSGITKTGKNRASRRVEYAVLKERGLESLADLVESSIAMDEVIKLIT